MLKEKILRDFEKMRFLNSFEKNKSENKLIFTVSKMDYDKNKYENKLFLYDKEQITRLKLYNTPQTYKFFDDFHLIYNVKSEKKKNKTYTKFYIQGLNSKKYDKKFNIDLEISTFYVIDNAKILIISSEKIQEELEKEDFKYDINRINFVENGSGYVYNDISKAYIYDINQNKLTKISNDDESVSFVNIQDNIIYYTTSIVSDVSSLFNKLNCYDVLSEQNKTLYDKFDYEILEAYKIQNDLILLASDCKTYGINENPKFYKLVDNNLNLFVDNEYSIDNSVNSDVRYKISSKSKLVGDTLFFLSTRGDKSSVYKLTNGEIEKYFDDINVVDEFVFLDNQLIVCGFDKQNLQEIYKYKKDDFSEKIRLTDYSEKFENHISNYKLEEFEFTSNESNLIGYVIYPKDYESDKKYPGILAIHGGPKTVYSSNFFYEMYLLSQNGYFVFYTNPHGSCGKDNKFADIRGKYGTMDYEDLMNFTDEVLQKYENIDSSRLAVMGGSYGGYMTNHIIGVNGRFKTAITQRSISNWVSFYGTSDIGYFFGTDQNACDYDVEKLWANSPMKNVDNIKTPVLILHSDEDYRCPLEQAVQLFTRLKVNKVKTKLVIYKGENHDLSRQGKVQSRVSRLEQILDWLKETL